MLLLHEKRVVCRVKDFLIDFASPKRSKNCRQFVGVINIKYQTGKAQIQNKRNLDHLHSTTEIIVIQE